MNLTRTLLGLVICVSMLPICLLSYQYTANINFDYNRINDEISLVQLRRILLISYDMENNGDSITFIYKNKEFELSLVNNKLILQPGTQIFLNDIENIYFEDESGCLYLLYERNKKEYKRVLYSEKRIYIDDFSDCDVLDTDGDSSEE